MMRKIVIQCFLLLVVFNVVSAQQRIHLSGTVKDKNGAAITGASVTVLNTNLGAVSGEGGLFTIDGLLPGKYTLQISAIGYTTINESIQLSGADHSPLALSLADADTKLDAVVVTAQKREEKLLEVPLSITALSSREVKEYRLWNTKDLAAIIPNFNSTGSGDERNVNFIRGIGTTSYNPAIATYVDGVNQFTLDSYSSLLADVERIEVLRGPQGTLYGRNAMGGVVNVITKQPTDKTTAFAEANIGNYGLQRYELGFRSPLVKNKLYLGASWIYSQRDGYYTNTYSNSSFDNQKILGGNYYLKYKISNAWSINANLRHQANRNDGAFPLSVFKTVNDAIKNGYVLEQNAKGEMVDNTLFGSLSIQYAGRSFNFTSQTAYQSNYRYYRNPVDGDFSKYDVVTIINNYGNKWNNVKTWTQEFRFTSPAANKSRLQWTAGAFLFANDNPSKQATHYGADAQAIYQLPEANFATINTSKGKGYGAAAYGQIVYTIAPQLDVIVGARYDYEDKKYNLTGEYQKDGTAPIVIRPDTAASVHYGAFSPKGGLTWHISSNNNLYAVYSRGFRTGGLTDLSSDPSIPPLRAYKPEYSNNFELGIKNNFLQNKLRLNVALFYANITDIQVPTLVLPDAITITRNAGKLKSQGVEVELATTPVKGLQLDYNFGYTEASYTNLKLADNGAEVDLKGKKQIYTPEFTSMLAAQYSYPLGTKQNIRIVVRGEWAWLGRQYFDLNNQFTQDPYSLLNTRAGFTTKNFDLMFWGRNLGGKKYVAYAYDFGAMHLGDPKTYGFTLSVRI